VSTATYADAQLSKEDFCFGRVSVPRERIACATGITFTALSKAQLKAAVSTPMSEAIATPLDANVNGRRDARSQVANTRMESKTVSKLP
jgi:hypothetical protein